MRLLVCGGAGFIGSNFVRVRVRDHGDDVVVLDKLTYAGRRENLQDVEHEFVHGAIEDPRAAAEAMDGRRRGGQLRRRDPRRSLDRRARRLRPHARRRAPTCCSRPRARAACATCRSPPTRSTARSRRARSPRSRRSRPRRPTARPRPGADLLVSSYHHTFGARDADLPRLEQLRALPVPREAHPADGPQRPARRQAARLRRRHERAQLALRRGLRARHRPRARARRAGRGLQRRRPRRVPEHRGRQGDPRATPAPARSSSSTSPTAPATTAATRWAPRRSARSAGRRRCASPTASQRTVDWYRDNAWWWEPIRSGDYRAYYERQYGRALGCLEPRAEPPRTTTRSRPGPTSSMRCTPRPPSAPTPSPRPLIRQPVPSLTRLMVGSCRSCRGRPSRARWRRAVGDADGLDRETEGVCVLERAVDGVLARAAALGVRGDQWLGQQLAADLILVALGARPTRSPRRCWPPGAARR